MIFIHDVIKILYIKYGYLPNYPYHMISDIEMWNAFIPFDYTEFYTTYIESGYLTVVRPGEDRMIYDSDWNTWMEDTNLSWFKDMYPNIDGSDIDRYKHIVTDMMYYISIAIHNIQSGEHDVKVPDWVYSYMLGVPIGPNSETLDIHDFLVLLDTDNKDDEYLLITANKCYDISEKWIQKLPKIQRDHRHPTIFGEPHVIRSLRLSNS